LHTKRQVQHKEKETGITIRMLRAQMNSHFIFNALGSIHQYVIKGKKEEAGTYLIKFSRLVRQILTNSTKEMVTLEEELEALELYIGLEGMRLDNKFTYTLTVDPSIEADTIMVPPLLVQPFVENAIWHGLARLESNDGHIQIHITREGDHLLFKISDNGIGRVAAATVNTKNGDKSPSLGLQITKDRLDMLNRKFKSGGKVFFKDLDRGLLVELTVPAVANV
jgi:sensor histidine kinase YesM